MQIILISDRLAKARSLSLSAAPPGGHAAAGRHAGVRRDREPLLADAALRRRSADSRRAAPAARRAGSRGRALALLRAAEPERDGGQARRDAGAADAPGCARRAALFACRRAQSSASREAPGLGGAAPTLLPPQNLSLAEFSESLAALSRQVEGRNDLLGVLEAQLFEQAVKKRLLPDHDAGERALQRLGLRQAHRSVYRPVGHARRHRFPRRRRLAGVRSRRRRGAVRRLASAIRLS